MCSTHKAVPPDQMRLFERSVLSIDRSFMTARRVQLDAASWVEHVPGWLSGSDSLFRELVSIPQWEQRDRFIVDRLVREPRLTAEYRDLPAAPIPLLREIADALSQQYGVVYDGLWMNLYRSHRDSTSWHADKPPARAPTSIVPVLSFGATRRFLIRPREGGSSRVWRPEAGDLIVMGGKCQRDWVHSVPKETQPAGPRVSLNFSSRSQNAA